VSLFCLDLFAVVSGLDGNFSHGQRSILGVVFPHLRNNSWASITRPLCFASVFTGRNIEPRCNQC
jgi:hypothetical protein